MQVILRMAVQTDSTFWIGKCADLNDELRTLPAVILVVSKCEPQMSLLNVYKIQRWESLNINGTCC